MTDAHPEHTESATESQHPPTHLERWISLHTQPSSGWIGTAELFESWRKYSEAHLIFTGHISTFSAELRKKGWVKRRSRDQMRQGYECRELKP